MERWRHEPAWRSQPFIASEAPAKGKKPRKATAGQKEMLLPIGGKSPQQRRRPSPIVQQGGGRLDSWLCRL
jgi:hypothetical protein